MLRNKTRGRGAGGLAQEINRSIARTLGVNKIKGRKPINSEKGKRRSK